MYLIEFYQLHGLTCSEGTITDYFLYQGAYLNTEASMARNKKIQHLHSLNIQQTLLETGWADVMESTLTPGVWPNHRQLLVF